MVVTHQMLRVLKLLRWPFSFTDVEDLHDTLESPVKPEEVQNDDWTEYAKSKAKLTGYFVPKQCNDFAIYELMKTLPETNESITEYATRLKKAGDKCDFANWTPQKMIKCILISNMADQDLRVKFLEKEHTLEEILDIARKKEDASARNKVMKENKGTGEDMIRKVKYKNTKLDKKQANSSSNGKPCMKCGYDKHYETDCPAKGKTCNFCKKEGHFSSVCFKKKNVKAITKSSDTDSSDTEDELEYVSKIGILKIGGTPSLMKICTGGIDLLWQPDTGTQRDIMDESNFSKFQKLQGKRIQLTQANIKLYAYGSNESLCILGSFESILEAGEKHVSTTIYVTKEGSKYPLLSEASALSMGLVKYNEHFLVRKLGNASPETVILRKEKISKILDENRQVFSDKIGKFNKHQVTLIINLDVKPVIQKPRRVPFNLEKKAFMKVRELESQDIIERVPDNDVKTWISPPVIAPKPSSNDGDICFCIDMRMANQAITRSYIQLPTTDDIVHKFQGATRFSKLDLKEAYHQFELSPESRNITSFYGPDGIYRYKRLNYGTKSAQDILQIEMQSMLSSISNQVNIADDILIGGTVEEHDKALTEVLRTLKENGITVNVPKCIFDVEEIRFAGLVFNKNGIKTDPKNVTNLREATPPRSKTELRSFLGMAAFSERFIPDFSKIVHPLRELFKSKKWRWEDIHQSSFEQVKESLSSDSLLHHYIIGLETEVIVDASETGLSLVLVQRKSKNEPFHPVIYKSRTLKDVECRYSATEREALSIRWAGKKLRKYLLGSSKFRIVTDHRPLQYMFHKLSGDLPPRIEKFVMDMQEFDYEIEYRPGKTCIADYMSRHHSCREGSSLVNTIELEARYVLLTQCCHIINEDSALSLNDIRVATEKSPLFQELKKLIVNETEPSENFNPELKPYLAREIQSELHVIDGVICRGKRIVIPPKLQGKAVKLSHKAHLGMSKSKALIRTFCWFPGIDKMVEKNVKECLTCQAVQVPRHSEPVKASDLPDGPWQYTEMDFQGPYPNGQYIFIMIDRYSRWPEMVLFNKAPNSKTTVSAMKSIFTNKGVPLVCQSDNGPPFQSDELHQFSKQTGFRLKHITPEWPRANGMVERFNRSMKEAVMAGNVDGVPLKEAAQEFIKSYRASPHSATSVSPYSAMHGGRDMKVQFPIVAQSSTMVDRNQHEVYKENMVRNRRGVPHTLHIGDIVIVRQHKLNKLTPPFNPDPFRIVEINGSMVTASNGKSMITRDASHFRRVAYNHSDDDDDDDDDDDCDDDDDDDDDCTIMIVQF